MGAHDVGRRLLAVLAVLILAAGCTSSASLTPTQTSTPAPTTRATATRAPASTLVPTPTSAPASQAPASQAAAVRCAETPGVTPSATVQWTSLVEGAEPTIKAGQAVKFVTTGFSPTVTEWGTNGHPADNPCIDKTIGSDVGPMSVVVTFYQPGDYNITCRKTPLSMHTVVHVQ
jgi:plastocyanin